MDGIPDSSVDFVIASHVIEHTKNPLRALHSAHSKLRPGGKFILTVPDKAATFDRDRELTSLSHLVLDYDEPCAKRDFAHYLDFFTRAFPQPDPAAAALSSSTLNHDIHFHVWTHDSFIEMIEYSARHISPWSEVWSHPPLPGPSGRPKLWYEELEFYCLLVK